MLNPAYKSERVRKKKEVECGDIKKKNGKGSVVDIADVMNAATA
jgi:hypothetical protein